MNPVADILSFHKPNKPDQTLCRNGHHKWQPVKTDPFAVHRGELITRFRCRRCGKEKIKAT
ncbi:MAG: hypothetical protein EBY45_10065 [Gammaproteobacteria bacterium]|nr:hypothetical protein [Gammaproteobacteria bacterium]